MTYMLDGLYMGSVDDAWNSQHLKDKFGISHLLTVNSKPVEREVRSGFQYKFIHALDTESQDLLSHFDESNQFIEDGRTAGGVLVHCFAGASRSGTLVLAYLMKKMGLSLEEAMKLAKKQRPEICPNEGFLSQLNLYESIGCKLDPSHIEYKRYKLEILASQMQTAVYTTEALSLPEGCLSEDPSLAKTMSETIFRCRKCRRPLFRAQCRMPHEEGGGAEVFTRPWQACRRDDTVQCTQSCFIQPVAWMESQILCLEGKLSCPKCSSKLGSFNWSGERCPCGTWVTPAFHIASTKVDECRPRVLPPGGPRQNQVTTSRTGVRPVFPLHVDPASNSDSTQSGSTVS